jgi:hypothetical protein
MTPAWRGLRSTPALGVLAAVLAWNVTFVTASAGLDQSWWAGLHMAAHQRLHFGSQMIWTYGPLGFLVTSGTYYVGLASLAFWYGTVILLAYAISLVWALRRWLPAVAAVPVAFVALIALPSSFAVLVIAAVWCMAALSEYPPRFAERLVSLGGGAFAALTLLIRLTWGPTILLMCTATLLALPGRRRELPILAGSAVVAFAALWFVAGQALGNLPEFARSTEQVVLGYSQAMGLRDFPQHYVALAIVASILLISGAAFCAARGRVQIAAGVTMALVTFLTFKEAVVRYDIFHVTVFFGTATALAMSIPWRGRLRVGGVLLVAAIGAISIHLATPQARAFNPVTHVKTLVSQLRTVASPGRQRAIIARGRLFTALQYSLERSTIGLLRGHRVHVDPWAAAVIWAYQLKWDPLPVFQDYQAYTPWLDAKNAEALRSPAGPDRILRENVHALERRFAAAAIDGRYPAWDPPEASLAMLCNFAPLQTTGRWQVLARVPDRCGRARLLRSVKSRFGSTVLVPSAARGELVFAKIHGVGVSGLEAVKNFLYRAKFRHAVVNGGQGWRLVPATAGDGLVLTVPPAADFPGPAFRVSPGARTLRLTGKSGPLTIDFYAMPIRVVAPPA